MVLCKFIQYMQISKLYPPIFQFWLEWWPFTNIWSSKLTVLFSLTIHIPYSETIKKIYNEIYLSKFYSCFIICLSIKNGIAWRNLFWWWGFLCERIKKCVRRRGNLSFISIILFKLSFGVWNVHQKSFY